MANKPISPYTRLLERAKQLARSVKYPKRRAMWIYPKATINQGWPLGDLLQRVHAANQLGHDVFLRATDQGLYVEYMERPDVPLDWA